jgi:hypothetical protein
VRSTNRIKPLKGREIGPVTPEQEQPKRGIAGEEVLKKGMEEKSRQFVEKGAEIYAKA